MGTTFSTYSTVELQIFFVKVLQIKFWEYLVPMFDTVYEQVHALSITYIITGEASSGLLA
jgi:hypothetical protein